MKKRHPFLTDEAMLACAEKARKAVCEAGDMLVALHGRACRRFKPEQGNLSDAERKAVAELSVHVNVLMAMLARFDRETVPALEKALKEDNS